MYLRPCWMPALLVLMYLPIACHRQEAASKSAASPASAPSSSMEIVKNLGEFPVGNLADLTDGRDDRWGGLDHALTQLYQLTSEQSTATRIRLSWKERDTQNTMLTQELVYILAEQTLTQTVSNGTRHSYSQVTTQKLGDLSNKIIDADQRHGYVSIQELAAMGCPPIP